MLNMWIVSPLPQKNARVFCFRSQALPGNPPRRTPEALPRDQSLDQRRPKQCRSGALLVRRGGCPKISFRLAGRGTESKLLRENFSNAERRDSQNKGSTASFDQ